jgi:hypothetical protein
MPSGEARMLFPDLAVEDLGRAVAFFEELGFTFDERFTDETATAIRPEGSDRGDPRLLGPEPEAGRRGRGARARGRRVAGERAAGHGVHVVDLRTPCKSGASVADVGENFDPFPAERRPVARALLVAPAWVPLVRYSWRNSPPNQAKSSLSG